MRKYFCDKCGRDITPAWGKTLKISILPFGQEPDVTMDLCAECKAEFFKKVDIFLGRRQP